MASQRFRTIKICPKDVACGWRHSRLVTAAHRSKAEGARHERHDLEGGPGEAGLDPAFGHRMGDGLFNRDYPTRPSVGKRSSVRPGGSIVRVPGAELMRADLRNS